MAAEKSGEKKNTVRLLLYAFLTMIAPPVGILFLVGSLFDSLKNKEKRTGTHQKTETLVRREYRKIPEKRPHGHTPVEYSYDSCAVDRRLEQLDVLYQAGLYTKEQYRTAKAKILQKV